VRKGTRLSPSLTIVVVVRGESLGTRLAPSPGYSIRCVPVWHESSRTGEGKKFKQDSEQHFSPFSNSQVCKEARWVVSSKMKGGSTCQLPPPPSFVFELYAYTHTHTHTRYQDSENGSVKGLKTICSMWQTDVVNAVNVLVLTLKILEVIIFMERGACHSRRAQHCQYPTLEHSLGWCCHDYTSLLQALPNQLLSYKSLARWNPLPKLSIPLSRIPLAGSGVGEWLTTTGHMNHTRVRVRQRRIYQKFSRVPLWRVFPHLIGILYTYGNRTVS